MDTLYLPSNSAHDHVSSSPQKIDAKYSVSPKVVVRIDQGEIPRAYVLIEILENLETGIAAFLQEDEYFMKQIPVVVDSSTVGGKRDMDVFWMWFNSEIKPRIDKLNLMKIDEISPALSTKIQEGFGRPLNLKYAVDLDDIFKLLEKRYQLKFDD